MARTVVRPLTLKDLWAISNYFDSDVTVVVTRSYRAKGMEGRTGFRHDFIFVILTELPAAITQTRGPYTCLKELQPGIPKSIGSVGLRFCCGKFCKNDGD